MRAEIFLGAIDIGSNSLLLSVIQPNQTPSEGFELLINESRVTGLAKGLQHQSEISSKSLDRSCQALTEYRQILSQYPGVQVRAVATEGLRRASNTAEVRRKLEQALGHPIEIISGDLEAELSFHSVQKELKNDNRSKIIFDIGGASTEVVLGDLQGIQQKVSLKVGSVILTEKFGLDKKSTEQKAHAIEYVLGLLKDSSFPTPSQSLGIGVAGTMMSIGMINMGDSEFLRERVHGSSTTKTQMEQICDEVLSLASKDRKKIVGLHQDRADVFGGGCCIALALCHHFQWSEVICMDSGVRFGLLYEMIGEMIDPI